MQATINYPETASRPRTELVDLLSATVLVLISAALAWSLWGKLQTLLELDPSWWLHEISRAAHGELPYRDFAWHFPPLAVMAFGWWLRIFGIRFDAVQALVDLISLAIVALSYVLLRHYVPRAIQFATCLLLLAVCSTSQTYFSLFSMLGYNPALITGALGLLIMLNVAVAFAGDHQIDGMRVLYLAIGAFIAFLSKPESIVAAIGILALLIAFDPLLLCSPAVWLRRCVMLMVACLLPALMVYGWFARVVGVRNLADAIGGYGFVTLTCPWWPTGVGLWAALAGLGAAIVLVVVGTGLNAAAWRKSLGSAGYAALWAAAILGFAVYLGYEFYAHVLNLSLAALTPAMLLYVLRSMAGTTDVFRAALWPAILFFMLLVVRGLRAGGKLTEKEFKQILFLTPPVLISSRSLFGTVISPFPEVPAMCYPFVILLAPYLLYQALAVPGEPKAPRPALRFVVILTLIYVLVRIGGGYSEIFSNRRYTLLRTNAGTVEVRDGSVSADVYNHVVQHTSVSDRILELPYGGGLSFATGRQSPAYSMLFVQLHPPTSIQALDVERMRAHPPALVIAKDQPHLGTYYGVDQPVGCEFPRIVWRSRKALGDPNLVLPIVGFIHENYHLEKSVAGWQILRHNGPIEPRQVGIAAHSRFAMPYDRPRLHP